ncbi:50S ribosomal protein L1 [Aquicella lusitana]|uniref:Large ribosomal subunit protein uL1 n=1 Tax=Aquicella lusitana TaxID=254246 RepID=A0A370GTH0_9COXI|nr:50S ribosomal protein L1 [Aquicella lusitana]RDI46987.1 large subunit ribosomal protein L1 [Aquicella lusitana]VVC73877.1 50S ribosomal protein L1 [Aquicella lusitana]
MAKLAKRIRAIRDLLTPGKQYSLREAFEIIQKMPKAKFRESVDLAVNLGVDPRKSDQAVRGAIVLPKGTGRDVRVAVFTSSAHADAAKKAGADLVGLEDLAEQVKGGKIDFDMVLATPDAMRIVGQLGQILGPRGLMPNPKDGTVTPDIANAVKNAKMGQVRYRTDKAGVIHCTIGKIDFNTADLSENLNAVLGALKKAKPSTAKGIYFKKITLSTTMGPGLSLDISSLAL